LLAGEYYRRCCHRATNVNIDEMSAADLITTVISIVSSVLARILAGLAVLTRSVRGGSDLPQTTSSWSPSMGSKAVLITNCDDVYGFGRALAMRLERRGFLVFAACSCELAATQIR